MRETVTWVNGFVSRLFFVWRYSRFADFYQRILRIFQCQYCQCNNRKLLCGYRDAWKFLLPQAFSFNHFYLLFWGSIWIFANAASRRKLSSVPVCGLYVDLHELAFHFFVLESIIRFLLLTHAPSVSRVVELAHMLRFLALQVYKSTYGTTISISFWTTLTLRRTVNMKVK
jgi:hypothetical protein